MIKRSQPPLIVVLACGLERKISDVQKKRFYHKKMEFYWYAVNQAENYNIQLSKELAYDRGGKEKFEIDGVKVIIIPRR